MKITKYITIACIVTSLSGCDYLDFDESIGKTQDEMYTYFENISSLATYIYSQLPQDYGAIGGAVRDAATDNAVYTWNSNSVYDIYNGNWSPLNPIDDVWGNYYTAIRQFFSGELFTGEAGTFPMESQLQGKYGKGQDVCERSTCIARFLLFGTSQKIR